jgi:hypothetical protein
MATLPPGTPTWFDCARDGSSLYMATDTPAIYQCINPLDETPVWTPILYYDMPILSGHARIPMFGYRQNAISGNILIASSRTSFGTSWAYGEYNGSTWTWRETYDPGTFNPFGIGLDSWIGTEGPSLYDSHQNQVEPYQSGGIEVGPNVRDIYHKPGCVDRYYTYGVTGNVLRLRHALVESVDLGNYTYESHVTDTKITGAEDGPQVYVVAGGSGNLWVSETGTGFTQIASWISGWAFDEFHRGGGDLIWVAQYAAEGAEIVRRYKRNGEVREDLTLNFWDLSRPRWPFLLGTGAVYG